MMSLFQLGQSLLVVAALIQLIPLVLMNDAVSEAIGVPWLNRKYSPPPLKDMAEGKAETSSTQRDKRVAGAINFAVQVHLAVASATILLILTGLP